MADYAAASHRPPRDTALWVVWYEDPDRAPEMFFGPGAEDVARARYADLSDSWNCYLLVDHRVSRLRSHPAPMVLEREWSWAEGVVERAGWHHLTLVRLASAAYEARAYQGGHAVQEGIYYRAVSQTPSHALRMLRKGLPPVPPTEEEPDAG